MKTRKLNRLKYFDYSQPGYYFVTICVDKMNCVFCKVVNGKMILNKYDKIVLGNLNEISVLHSNIEMAEFIVMPNHIHAIIIVVDAKFAFTTDMTKMILSKIIQQFKRISTIKIKNVGLPNFKWQRSFYDIIIRNEKELFNIRKYIKQNPLKCELEKHLIENIDF